MTATMAEINEEVSVNPDAQAAVTDFLDYTEYLPTDIFRSLALIRKLDETYERNENSVHDLTRTYSILPSLPPEEKPDAADLRKSISQHLDLAITARKSAYAEAVRLYDLADRHQERLNSILAKLKALPKPASRDPTPQPIPQPQPNSTTKRPRNGREIKSATRLTLKGPKHVASGLLARPRHRRVTVPGEVMPPYDPDEPIASTEVSEWDSEPPSPLQGSLSTHKLHKRRSTTDPERRPREIANYRKPTPPPEDAPIGGEHRPWVHLTDYEMFKLRKKMKKNYAWEPSEVMIKRELAEKGRGWDNYYKAKAAAGASGATFIDIDQPTIKPIVPIKAETPKAIIKEDSTRPKTLKRLESKSEKPESTPKDSTALAAHEAQLAARKLGDIGSQFANLFQNFKNSLGSLTSASSPTVTTPNKLEAKPPRKRKLEVPLSTSPPADTELRPLKKQKLLPKTSTSTSIVAHVESPPVSIASVAPIKSLKLTVGAPPINATITPTPDAAVRPINFQQRVSTVPTTLKGNASPPSSRPPSRRSAATSMEPTSTTVTSSRVSRRSSATPAAIAIRSKTPPLDTTPKTPAYTAASRRSKREAPGTVTQSSQDGGAAVSVSRRTTKPAKPSKVPTPKATTIDAVKPEIRTDIDGRQEVVDPDEDRYCICGDVSYGQMIACELDDKCEFGEWFHMECVELAEMPPRTTKWYCPGDRKKFHKGEKTNGLVRHGS